MDHFSMLKTILTNCTVIDCTGSPPMTDTTITIKDSKIVALKQCIDRQMRRKVRIFDLRGGYVLPGLWNTHTHLGDVFPDPKHMLSSESVIDEAIRAGRNVVDTLRTGVIGIRAVGEDAFIDVAWKRAFDAGVFVGPRLFLWESDLCHGSGRRRRIQSSGWCRGERTLRDAKGGARAAQARCGPDQASSQRRSRRIGCWQEYAGIPFSPR